MLKAEDKFAEKHGKTVDEIILAHIYGDKEFIGLEIEGPIPLNVTMAAAKLWKDKTMIPISEGSEGDEQLGPATYLPEERPDLKLVSNDS